MPTGRRPGAIDCSRLASLAAVGLPVLNSAVVLDCVPVLVLCCPAWQLVACMLTCG